MSLSGSVVNHKNTKISKGLVKISHFIELFPLMVLVEQIIFSSTNDGVKVKTMGTVALLRSSRAPEEFTVF